MRDDAHVCLCFHISQRKIVNYFRRERPPVASLINRDLPAGTGCGWCVPFIEHLHEQVMADAEQPDLAVDESEYASGRVSFRKTGRRETS